MRIVKFVVLLALAATMGACGSESGTKAPAATTQADAEISVATPGADTMVAPPANFHSVLEKTSWVLDRFTFEGEMYTIPAEKPAVTLSFNRGLMSSLGSCYRFSANYATTDEGAISLSNVGTRLQDCTPEDTRVLRRYMEVMEGVATFKVASGDLTLTGPKGSVYFK